jgi:hypothetical protein
MDPIKEAFQKIKEEMLEIRKEISALKQEISLKPNLSDLGGSSANPSIIPTQTHHPTDTPAQTPAVPQEIGGLKQSSFIISTGNRGGPTNTSTDSQTNQQTSNFNISPRETLLDRSINLHETLSSVDNIKRELRLKFKRLTTQEMLVFSTLYSLESQGFQEITYKILANNLNLSESSIRDYISKISAKGIPVSKTRLNNKLIVLNISQDLQKIASLATIMRLREL